MDPRRPLAVIIGIADYVAPRLRLATPRRDAEALAALLEAEHGYEVRLVRDREATGEALRRLFDHELPAIVDEARPLVVYFAGHGTATDSLAEPRGYLVPADGGDRVESLIAMPDLARALDRLPCRHLLVLLDCCFAGAFRWSAARDVATDEPPALYRERFERFLATAAWQVITSAGHDEPAADVAGGLAVGARDTEGEPHSPFLRALLDGLRGAADAFPRNPDGSAGDGVITATELYLYLRHALGDRAQTPGLWILPRHAKGEFIFYTPRTRPELPDAPTLSLQTSPYRGAAGYDERHAALFHGRRGAVHALIAHLDRTGIAIVVGRAASGKSSLVHAGLLPALRADHPDWLRSLLVIDPLDDLFGRTDLFDRSAGHFLTQLGALAATGVRIVATLRNDLELAACASPLGASWDRIRFPLPDLTQDELREAIEAPALHHGLVFDPPAAVDQLINSVIAMPGALPLLSTTLHALYVDCIHRGTLRVPPGDPVSRALRERAERVDRALEPAARLTLRRLLLRLITITEPATLAIARRQLPLAELAAADPAERARVDLVIDALTASPPLVIRGGSPTTRYLELAHDAIVRDWPALHAWLADAAPTLALQRALTEATALWLADHQHPGYLWRDDPRGPRAERALLARRTS